MHSQFGQDSDVMNYHYIKNGYFVEVGAYDGDKLSNTYSLEHYFGWKGILIEANPIIFESLKKNRPNAKCIDKACYSKTGLTLKFKLEGLLSGIQDNLNTYKQKLETSNEVAVETETLTSILDRCDAPKAIDFLSIDVEGAEMEVLKGIDFHRYSFYFITVEHNFEPEKRAQMRNLLEKNGYRFMRCNNVDDYYVHL